MQKLLHLSAQLFDPCFVHCARFLKAWVTTSKIHMTAFAVELTTATADARKGSWIAVITNGIVTLRAIFDAPSTPFETYLATSGQTVSTIIFLTSTTL